MRDQLSFESYEQTITDPLRGHTLTPVEAYIASLLLKASKAQPITNSDLRELVKVQYQTRADQRTIKAIIRSLRKVHHFPVLASFTPPYGYWWCKSAEEMITYYTEAMARLKDELQTLSQLIKINFPTYAGQLNLEEGVKQ